MANRLEIPVTGKVLYATGDVKLWVNLDVELKDAVGHWHRSTFRVDTCTEITTFPAHAAKALGLPMPQQVSAGVAHTQTGLAVRSGSLRFRMVGLDATEYAVPCFVLGDPVTPAAGPPAALPRNLLQPLALLDWLRFTLDKDPSAALLYGMLGVEKK